MKLLKYTLALCALGLFFTFNALTVKAQSALDGFEPNANNVIYAVALQPDGKILIGGNFTTLSPNGGALVTRNRIARLNLDGSLDTTFNPNANGTVYSIGVQPDGKILIGGGFGTLAPNGGAPITRSCMARLNVDGTVDTTFDPRPNSFVRAIAIQPDGDILIGGQYNAISPNGGAAVARNNLARVKPDGSLDTTFDPNPNGIVYSIVPQEDGKILVGGGFNTMSPNGGAAVSRGRLARLNADGTLDSTLNTSASAAVWSIAVQADGKILIGGEFVLVTPTGGASVNRQRIARLSPNGSVDFTFDPKSDGVVYFVKLQTDGKILLGGLFGGFQPNGGASVARTRCARLNMNGTVDAGFNPAVFDFVQQIAVQPDGRIVIVGNFQNLAPNGGATLTRRFIARLERDGLLDRTLNISTVGSYVTAVAVQPDGRILIGGSFTQILGAPRNNIARLNADGTLDITFNPNANNAVYAIAVQPDGKILVGGFFNGVNSIGGQARNRIARLNTDGTADSFDPNANNVVYSFALQAGGKILVGGEFDGANSIGGQARNRIARLNSDGTVDSFNPNANSAVYAIALQPDGKVLVGGFFSGATGIGGQARNRIARLNSDGSLDTGFNPGANAAVYSFALQSNGMIIVGGDFAGANAIGSQTRSHIARLNPDGTVDTAFNPSAGSTVFSINVQSDGKILLGGQFTTGGGLGRNGIARLNPDGTVDSFNPNANSAVYAVAVQSDGKILAGGLFNGTNSIGGQARNLFARLTNNTAAFSTLSVTNNSLTLTRDGSAPQFTRVVFEQSVDNGANWTPLGNGTPSLAATAMENNKKSEMSFAAALAPQTSNYTLTGLSLPTGQNILVRARGYFRSGYQNGSEMVEDKVQNAFLLGTTAAGVSVSGRALTPDGSGLKNARIILTDARGNSRTTLTASFGYFNFDAVEVGEVYIVSIVSKRYQFAPQAVIVNEELSELNFIALE